MLRRRGGGECHDVHGQGHRVVGVVATGDPCFILLGEEASAMEHAYPDVNNVVVEDGILGKIFEGGALKKASNEELKSLRRVPFKGYRVAIRRSIFGGRSTVLGDKPGKHLAENGVWVFHADLLVGLLESDGNEVEEGIDERRVHVDDVIASLLGQTVRRFDGGALVCINGPGVVGHTLGSGGKG